jgi:hypothetical protein
VLRWAVCAGKGEGCCLTDLVVGLVLHLLDFSVCECATTTLERILYCELLFPFLRKECTLYVVWKQRDKLCIKVLGKLFQICRIKLN